MKHYSKPLAIDKQLNINKKKSFFSGFERDRKGRMVKKDSQITRMVITYHESGKKATTKMDFYGTCCDMSDLELADVVVHMFNANGIIDRVVRAEVY